MSVRILLGVTDPELVDALRTQLGELADVELAAVERSSNDVTGAVNSIPAIDVILVDQDIAGLPALDLIRDLTRRHPQLGLVLITTDQTAETYHQAMSVGARGVISREPALSELQNRIEAAADWARSVKRHIDPARASAAPDRSGRVVAVVGAKGGTGTTTLAVHLAGAALAARQTVCLVDMDLQKGDVPSYLDITHRRSIADLIGAADELDGSILADALYIHQDGLHTLLAPAEGERAEEVTAKAARQILAALRSRYDLVIVDCGAFLTDGSAMSIEIADRLLVTATPDLPSIRAVKRFAALCGRLNLRKPDDLSVVLVRQDRKNEVQPDFARKVLGLPMLKAGVPAVFRGLEEAANTGSPAAVDNAAFRRAIGQVALEAGVIDEGAVAAAGAGKGRARGDSGRGDAGVALTEFAGIFFMIVFLIVLCWEVVLIGLTSMYTGHAANEAARAVAVLGYQTPEARAEVRRRTAERVPGMMRPDDHLRIKIVNGYAEVSMDAPAMLASWHVPFELTARSKIVKEGRP
ncbi:CobQ/CobB/MinD/ParA nucleotide binding domain-containing protein [Actinomadura darangshiensis]|uniref:CobQ/CobB/MinD/ParA nucleotide binding domain-containing protein n=1 Tax=Actinomadura darangshiensis TaxID=705336 RepID=A0A4R5B1T0_9ACTN|nr:AAA family ATPase [Actinomadura darangshiensis]TDD79591.1 CobQ/CobB/MinD/ParA nucleotide binding domain-containing protein [Actinomadura darangshiensis]